MIGIIIIIIKTIIIIIRVFHQLILEHLHMRNDKKGRKSSKSKRGRSETVTRERLQIPVRRYDAEVFRMLIQFIHSGTAYITVENVSVNVANVVNNL